ncbi:MAG: hypothetical protein ACRDCH_00065 [Metamycoplasmataceae bacterium]
MIGVDIKLASLFSLVTIIINQAIRKEREINQMKNLVIDCFKYVFLYESQIWRFLPTGTISDSFSFSNFLNLISLYNLNLITRKEVTAKTESPTTASTHHGITKYFPSYLL